LLRAWLASIVLGVAWISLGARMRTIAYLDANSGSLIGGAIAAGGAAVVVLLKSRMHRFMRLFRGRSGSREAAPTIVTPPEET
jgi:hypothetical protein